MWELGFAVITTHYCSVTDEVALLTLGTFNVGFLPFEVRIVWGFDMLSGFFLGILTVALIFCYYFLVEYFEYDVHGGAIITLSALFSQVALLYFAAFDVLSLLFFWELISLISFFLVQHWQHRLPTYKAGMKVFTISQFGDLPLLLGLFLLASRGGTTAITDILGVIPKAAHEYSVIPIYGPIHVLSVIGYCLTFAVFLKAAQFIFYPWLLDAMEAPVPISAQLHSSTLVVIGFYLFYRFYPVFLYTPSVNTFIMWSGLVTIVGASVLGFFQTDGKRLLACSTASQLGYVVVALGLGLYEEGLVLLAFCCCNKAFTFVWFGGLMQRFAGLSDFRLIGGSAVLS